MRKPRIVHLMTLGYHGRILPDVRHSKNADSRLSRRRGNYRRVKALFDKHPGLDINQCADARSCGVSVWSGRYTLDAEIADSVALQAPGATRVVSSIANGN